MLSRDDAMAIRRFVYTNARPLDLYRWQYHFEGGSADNVRKALSVYQNPDGGFGHALEADAWNPASSPIQTSTAVHLLWETGLIEKDRPMIWSMLQYLDSGADMEGDRWLSVVPSNNDAPHAPWWEMDSVSTSHSEYNPTGILAGFGLYFAPAGTALSARCKKIAGELVASFLAAPEISMHSLLCVESLLSWIKRAGLTGAYPAEAMEKELLAQMARLIQADENNWEGYACRPSEFIRTPQHPLYADFHGLVERELDWLTETRNADGVWNIPWIWAGYDKAFAISENWWKTDVLLRNVRFLRAFGRLETRHAPEN